MSLKLPLIRLVTVLLTLLLSCGLSAQDKKATDIAIKHLGVDNKANILSETDIADVIVTDQYMSKKSGITHTYLRQRYDGIEVYGANANVSINRDGKVISYGNSFLPNLEKTINTKSPNFNAAKAVYHAAKALNLKFDQSKLKVLEAPAHKAGKIVFNKADISGVDIPVKPMYQRVGKGEVRLAWDLSLQLLEGHDWWSMRVDAQTGEILHKHNWTVTCNFDHKHMDDCELAEHQHQHNEKVKNLQTAGLFKSAKKTKAIPKTKTKITPILTPSVAKASSVLANTYEVYAMPLESPNHGGRTIEAAPWNNAPTASPFGWHDDNGVAGAEYTITRGNNVYAQDDINGNNGFGSAPSGGNSLDFIFPVNLCNAPSTYLDASLTNLFYWNNIMHDVWYEYGFDEVSGNFQQNNYGNGGAGNDYVIADGQDGSGTNNANFGTPGDGGNPQMQMFLWTGGGAPPTFSVNSPGGVAGNYGVQTANFGPSSGTFTANLVIANDGTGAPTEACNALVNGAAINGNIALVDRGNCNFTQKVQNCENVGAIAVLVCNNVAGGTIAMGGTDPGLTIPAVMISQADCATIRAQIPTVNVTLTFAGCSPANTDGSFDNGIVAHEYGHGISTRLVGGPANSGCLGNSEQQGEGWSDYFGLMLTIEPGDAGTDIRGIGTFAQGQPITGGGIRTYPYSTDMAINPHTYNDISTEAVPHGVGSVWCAVLWDMTWDLIAQYGFDTDFYTGTGGNNISMQLVIEGLKLQPCSSGFVESRDAILAADQALYGGANECLIWSAFAGRGLGFSAVQGSDNSNTDQTEGYDLPPSCDGISIQKTTVPTIQAGNTITYTVTIENNTGGNASNVVITDQLPAGTTYVNGSASCTATASGSTLTMNIGTMTNAQVIVCTYDVSIPAAPFTTATFLDDLEAGTANWTVSSGIGTSGWATSTANPNSGSTAYFVPNVGADNDQYLVLQAPSFAGYSGTPQLRFWHDYDTESGWDGGMVEASTNGTTWTDLGASMTQNGYNGSVGASSNNNIANRDAFTGNSGGYIQTIADLSAYAGQTNVQIRFRFGSDDNTFSTGWYVDDVEFYDAVVVTNNACVNFTGATNTNCDQVSTTVLQPTCTPIIWYADTDNDTFGDPNNTLSACTQPLGYIADNTDCNDNNPSINPNATETCNGIDDNCNGNIDEGITIPTWYADTDNDNFGDPNNSIQACTQPIGYIANNTDCDDTDPAINPAAMEQCNSADDNCNGAVDEGVTNQTWYADTDNDGFGDPNVSQVNCAQPAGYVLDNTDCDDTNGSINTAATEICDGVDNDCDGQIDEGVLNTYYADTDGDGFGDVTNTIQACTQPTGYVTNSTDCDDTNANNFPGNTEVCDGVDNDCDGQIDEGLLNTYYADTDGDGFGDPNSSIQACSQPAGYVLDNTDCDDTNAAVNPGAAEACNAADDNCNGSIDEGITIPTWYADTDNDNYGDPNNSIQACTQPAGYILDNTDCDDTNAAVNPGAAEACNSADDNCNGSIDEGIATQTWYADTDNDNYGDPNNSLVDCAQPAGYIADNTDCDDTNAAINPGATEVCNGADDNCNGAIDEGSVCGVTMTFRVFLEGNYAGATNMTNTLNANSLLPTTQPYNTAPWSYGGAESVSNWSTIPNAVDWILVEVRDAANNFNVVETQAAVVLTNGMVVSTNGNVGVTFNTLTAGGSYYFAIRHRNHLDIMSSNAVTVPNMLDFSAVANVMSGAGQAVNLGSGVYGLHAGDVNADGIINVYDYNQYLDDLTTLPTINQYRSSDCNLDSTLGTADFNTYQPNASKLGIHQIRY